MTRNSNYPFGFDGGVLIKEILGVDSVPGKIFWVGNNASTVVGEKGASDTANKGTFLQPFSTIDYAIGRCKAGRGDVIFVRPSHTTSVITAGGITLDVDGVNIIGLGEGNDKPTITFATAAAASIVISSANNTLKNLRLVCNIASQNHMIDLTGSYAKIEGCDFVEGSATGLSFITADGTDADADGLQVINCTFKAPTAGNYDNAIQLAKDFQDIRIIGNEIYGDFDVAGIDVPAGGNAQVDLQIGDCKITNLLTGQHAIEINGTGNTGKVYDTYIETDAQATSIDAGGLEVFNVLFHDGTDQRSAIPALDPIVDSVGTFNERLGTRINKTAATLPASTTQDIFTVAGGRVLITLLTGEVTTVVQAQACNLSVVLATTVGADVTLASTVDINADEAGTIYGVEGDGSALVATSSGAFLQGLAGGGMVVAEGTINITTSATNTGATSWEAWYIPLDDGATVVSA